MEHSGHAAAAGRTAVLRIRGVELGFGGIRLMARLGVGPVLTSSFVQWRNPKPVTKPVMTLTLSLSLNLSRRLNLSLNLSSVLSLSLGLSRARAQFVMELHR